MANKRNWVGILVIVLVFGMMVIGCGDGVGDGGGNVDAKYRGTYKSLAYSGTTSLTTTVYTYIISANKAEYSSSSNGVISSNTIYDEAWTEGQELWVRGNNTRSLHGRFDPSGNTLTIGSRFYTKGNPSYSLNGTWTYSIYKYNFSGSNTSGTFEYYQSDNPYQRGTYTTSNNSMTITITHMSRSRLSSYVVDRSLSQEWYTGNEIMQVYMNPYWAYPAQAQDLLRQQFSTVLNSLYTTSTVLYALDYSLFLDGRTYTKE